MKWNRRYDKLNTFIAHLQTDQFLMDEKLKAILKHLEIEVVLNPHQKTELFVVSPITKEN